jgi:hypothetical protein
MFLNKNDVKALISSSINDIKMEFKKEIDTLNERIIYSEKRNQHLEQLNLNLNTFIQQHFKHLDIKIDENHQYILNQWNPFMQSTIESVKNDLIETMNNNKKDDIELSNKVNSLDINVNNLNKLVVDEGFVNIVNYQADNNNFLLSIKKNIEVFDLFDKDIYFNTLMSSIDAKLFFNIKNLNFFPKLKKINLTKILNTYYQETYIQYVCILLREIIDDKEIIDDPSFDPHLISL